MEPSRGKVLPPDAGVRVWQVIKSCEPVLGNNFAIEIIPDGQVCLKPLTLHPQI